MCSKPIKNRVQNSTFWALISRDQTLTDYNYVFYFYILDLNVNEWVSVKGCILGIWTDGPWMVNTTYVETLDEL